MSKRRLDCGVCGSVKVEQRGRLVCKQCMARYQREASERRGSPVPITDAIRLTKKRYAKRVRPSGLTNQKVYSLRKLYGVSESEYIAMIERQDGKCGICRETLTSEALVDHDHETGDVRGLLCRPCNFAIGLLGDDPERLRAAASYLERNRTIRLGTGG